VRQSDKGYLPLLCPCVDGKAAGGIVLQFNIFDHSARFKSFFDCRIF